MIIIGYRLFLLIIAGYCAVWKLLSWELWLYLTGIVSDVSMAKRMQLVCERISGAHFGNTSWLPQFWGPDFLIPKLFFQCRSWESLISITTSLHYEGGFPMTWISGDSKFHESMDLLFCSQKYSGCFFLHKNWIKTDRPQRGFSGQRKPCSFFPVVFCWVPGFSWAAPITNPVEPRASRCWSSDQIRSRLTCQSCQAARLTDAAAQRP